MKKKALAFAAAACAFGMLLSGCGSSNGGSTADKGSNVITAYNSEPQNPLIPGNTNETGGGIPVDLLFARLVSYDTKGNAQNEVAESIKSNDDGTQFDIKIKSGWKFADGTPVTAESFTKAWTTSPTPRTRRSAPRSSPPSRASTSCRTPRTSRATSSSKASRSSTTTSSPST